jgi:4-hydroxybenzoyl-CoA reductase subunit beta
MRLPRFTHQQPADIGGLVSALTEFSGAKLLAGGTDLLVNMKHRIELPETLVSLKKIADLRGIRQEGDAVLIGAATTLKEIRRHAELERKFPALVQAAMAVGSYRHQAMGTLGGNLCQNTRCRFFNQSWQWRQARSLCYKVGGEDCHVIGKKNVCFSTYSGDVAPALLVLDASLRIMGPDGPREIPLAHLYSGEGRTPLTLGRGEFVTAVAIPGTAAQGKSHYEKFSIRGSIDFPIVGAALWQGAGGVRVAYTGVDRAPVRAAELEAALAGQELTEASRKRAAALAHKAAKIAPTSVQPVSFKRELMGVLFEKAMRAISGNGKKEENI